MRRSRNPVNFFFTGRAVCTTSELSINKIKFFLVTVAITYQSQEIQFHQYCMDRSPFNIFFFGEGKERPEGSS